MSARGLGFRAIAETEVRNSMHAGDTLIRDIQRRTGYNRATIQQALADIGAIRDDSAYPYRFTLPSNA